MLHFDSDYMRGAHPEVLRLLIETNMSQTSGYGTDSYTGEAERLILDSCRLANGKVWFLEGGTQTNTTVIDAILHKSQGVLAAESAHINVHEAGAIENSGHKVLTLPSHGGKIDASELREYIRDFYADSTWPHMVAPGMVYISHPTELGTLYSKEELKEISDVCREAKIPLYIDGARLAYGLASDESELTLPEIASLCDVFYIGGTKCGTLFGEAVVASNPEILPNFFTIIKMHGGLLAKGRLLGIQFRQLFTDGLYHSIGRNGILMARKLRETMNSHGYRCYIDSPTNQQFFIMPNTDIEKLSQNVSFELWGAMGESETPVRFVTDWGTTIDEINRLSACLDELK